MKFSLFIELNDTSDDVVNAIQVFAKDHGYAVIKKHIKSHDSKRSEVAIDVMIIKCSKNDKIKIFKIIKRKREAIKKIDCSFDMIARENKNV